MHELDESDIQSIASLAGLTDYSGTYSFIGQGEVNESYLLGCENREVVLRYARFPENLTLQKEAETLIKLDIKGQIPALLFFDALKRYKNRVWILESYITGEPAKKLHIEHFKSLGHLLARVHAVRQNEPTKQDYWQELLSVSTVFGDEALFLQHPDTEIRSLVQAGKNFLQSQSDQQVTIQKSLIHGDVTPSNMLILDKRVGLIDWEFSMFKDPMADFSTMYYDDMELNNGRWRVHIKREEKSALFQGYRDGGGDLDTAHIQTWQLLDKIGALLYLYWKIHQSGHEMDTVQRKQYTDDLQNLIRSLKISPPLD